jgi:hypothetical protein
MKTKRNKRVYQDQTGIWVTLKHYGSKKREYITEDDYYRVERLIFNNLPLDYTREVEKTPAKLTAQLLPGEEYKYLPGVSDSYVITNKYRVICVKNGNTVKAFISYYYHYVIVDGKQINLKKEYERLDWDYDYELVYPLYQEHNWKYLDYRERHAPRHLKKGQEVK